tara:strand:- start:301 stop:741 length:441 start_codon:yes stop_codon:yes gene_type:complete
MKYLILLPILLGLMATPLRGAPHYETGSGARGGNPCGATLFELDSLTSYWERLWGADYKDFTKEEVAHFVEKRKIGRSDIAGVRVFRAERHTDYAIVVYFLFQNTLNGEPLVSVNCVLALNGAPGMVFMPESFQELMGKTYQEIGQ